MTEQILDNLYSIPIALPNNPLKCLNAYFIDGGSCGRNLLVDTGFNNAECLAALTDAFAELGVNPAETDVFLTHLHSDHTGNAAALAAMGCRIFMGQRDYSLLCNDNRTAIRERAISEGMSPDTLSETFRSNPATLYAPAPFDATTLGEGDILSCGGYCFECILTPGHTPGHMCLYDKSRRILISGDHILFDISPNITCWAGISDSLGDYLSSLLKTEAIAADIVLPAHRSNGNVTLARRTRELLLHHERRLSELEGIIKEHPRLSAYELTGMLRWRIHASSWDDFPPAQKWFAMGETMAHLDHLLALGRINRLTDPTTSRRTYIIR